jgi:hypothetical protein
MNMPSFKGMLQKLSVFKNNLSLLVPVIIVLVSVLLFIPTQLMSSKLKGRIEEESIRKAGNRIPSLSESAVSAMQWEEEAKLQKNHASDANEIAALASQSTQRALLSYDVFPDPNSSSALVFQEFGRRFRAGIDELITNSKAGDCPTEEELNRGVEDSAARSRMRRGLGSARPALGGGSPGSRLGMPRMLNNVQRMIVDQMCQDRAENISFYVSTAELTGYEYWGDYKYDVNMVDAIKDCWYHQLAYWVIEDIVQTINTVNSGHDNALTAPVKRFLRISFTMGLKRPGTRGGVFTGRTRRKSATSTEESDKPTYVLSAADGLTESCTGRFSKDDINVIHFNFAVAVSAKSVLPFIKELCSAKKHEFRGYPDGLDEPQTFKHNQITVLEDRIGSIDREELNHRLYRYGEDSVVELDLICEYIFNKKGYDEIMPESVKKTLKGEDQTQG